MSEPLTLETFEPLVNNRFLVQIDVRNQLELTLYAVEALPVRSGPGGALPARKPFSLLFHGPFQPIMPQRIYTVTHESLVETSLFFVPIGPDQVGQRYEVIFN